jgi:hypothetical protein
VNIQHVVNSNNGDPILLADNGVLVAENILVQIYDDDTGGVIIRESNGITALMEMNETDNNGAVPPHLYKDEYYVRLTRAPVESVEIDVSSIAVATDYRSSFTPKSRNFTKRTFM